jgi:Integrase core domain
MAARELVRKGAVPSPFQSFQTPDPAEECACGQCGKQQVIRYEETEVLEVRPAE